MHAPWDPVVLDGQRGYESEPMRVPFTPPLWSALSVLSALCGCTPELTVGEWSCDEHGVEATIPDATDPIAVPWSTGFESRFCDYTQLAGFCYTDPVSSYTIVSSPAHTGHHAAAFRVQSTDPDGTQARCVRQGALPTDAYYGAWFFLPQSATNNAVWNLVHFQGGLSLIHI